MWRWLTGIEAADWAAGGDWRVEWLSTPSGDAALLVFLGAVGALMAVWLLYRWEGRRLAWTTRMLLVLLRLAALGLVALMLCEPVAVLTTVERAPSQLLVLFDTSQSMDLRDGWATGPAADSAARHAGVAVDQLAATTRRELAQGVLDGGLLERLRAEGGRVVHVHPFAERLGAEEQATPGPGERPAGDVRPGDDGDGGDSADDEGDSALPGRNTAIGQSLRQALAAYRGLPISGVLLVSDGQSNSGEALESAAELARSEGVPVSSLAMGTAAGPRNVEVSRLEAGPVVFVRDTARAEVLVRSRGMPGETVELILERRPAGGEWQELGRQSLVLQEEGESQQVAFEYSGDEAGRVELRARLGELGAELTKDDNMAVTEVQFVPPQVRVLLISGSTFPEVQFLRNSWVRDKGIDVSTWDMSADATYDHPGDLPIRRLPTTSEELNEYDCLVLYDPNPDGWPQDYPELLERFVTQAGGGLVYIAGEMQTERSFDRQADPALSWLRLLPVVREPGLFRSEVRMELSRRNAWRLQPTDEGRRDNLLQFAADPAENDRLLEGLPGMYWHFPVTRAKSGASVLAVHGDPRMRNEHGPEVLLATQRVGPGRTFFVGFDSTYRWRYLDEQTFDGFWARLVDRAGRAKQLGGEYPFRLRTDKAEYQPGDVARLSAFVLEGEGADLQSLQGELERAGDPSVRVSFEPAGEREFVAEVPLDRPGPYTLRAWAGDGDAERVKHVTLQFQVRLPSAEFAAPTLDRERLERLAVRTGGRVHELPESDRIAESFTTSWIERRLEDRSELWKAPLLWIGLVTLLAVEWIVRKRCQLV